MLVISVCVLHGFGNPTAARQSLQVDFQARARFTQTQWCEVRGTVIAQGAKAVAGRTCTALADALVSLQWRAISDTSSLVGSLYCGNKAPQSRMCLAFGKFFASQNASGLAPS